MVKRLFWRFGLERAGSTAIVFAFSMLLVIGGVGLSVDGARVYGAKQRLQQALDAAVLAAARRAATDRTVDQALATFNSFFAASQVSQGVTLRSVVPDTSQGRRISAEAVADVPTVLMPLLGMETVEIRAQSKAEFGFTRLEIALALDNTGSMAGAKLDALKDSAHRLIDTLLGHAPEPDAVRFALVPFGQYVNVGLDNRGASWLSVPADYSEQTETCAETRPILSSTNCRLVSYTYYDDGKPMTGTYEQCDNVYGDPVYQCTTSTRTYTWNGCVGSRNSPLNVQDGDYGTRVPGLMNVYCPSPIQPLTSRSDTLSAAIDGMVATGATYIPAGVMWGWRALTPGDPYPESAGARTDANGDLINKILILMTDGANTTSPTYPAHDGTDVAAANAITATACTNVKAAGVSVFTIAFDVTDSSVKSLLRDCASSAGRFFDAADSSQLDAAMQAIGQQLSALRLTN